MTHDLPSWGDLIAGVVIALLSYFTGHRVGGRQNGGRPKL